MTCSHLQSALHWFTKNLNDNLGDILWPQWNKKTFTSSSLWTATYRPSMHLTNLDNIRHIHLIHGWDDADVTGEWPWKVSFKNKVGMNPDGKILCQMRNYKLHFSFKSQTVSLCGVYFIISSHIFSMCLWGRDIKGPLKSKNALK